MKVHMGSGCPARIAVARLALAAWMGFALAAPLQAQEGAARSSSLPNIGEAVQSLRADLNRLQANGVDGGEAPRVERRNTRDPFQTTPELRSRSGRSGFAPTAIGSGDLGDEPVWRVQALLLGGTPRAVLVRNPALGRGTPNEPVAFRQRVVREGDPFEMPDGRLFTVNRIDRRGVWMVSDGVEEEQMRIQ